MKSPKVSTPADPIPIPPVRESGMEVQEKRKSQLMEERKKRGIQATLMKQPQSGNTLGGL
jgi:hypothetical protein